jgi:hypothetical protein
VQPCPGVKDRREETYSLHVIEMEVAEAEVDLLRTASDEVHPEIPNSGSCVEDD